MKKDNSKTLLPTVCVCCESDEKNKPIISVVKGVALSHETKLTYVGMNIK